jgi:trimeric autotransporter adhesin
MPPNNALIRNYATFGDLTQRDVYLRHKNQSIKEGDVENYFYHLNSDDQAVNTVIEKVSFAGNSSMYEVFTKPTSGDVNYAAQGSMVEVTTAKTYIRSLEFEAAGNVAFGNAAVTGTLGVSGAATLSSDLSVLGNASVTQSLSVTGNAAVTGTLGVTGATTLSSDLSVLGNTSVAQSLSVTGDAAVAGNTAVTGTLGVTGATTLSSDLSVLGNTSIAQSLSVTGDAAVAGNTAVTGTLGVTGAATLSSDLSVLGNASVTKDFSVSGGTTLVGVNAVDVSAATLTVSGNISAENLSATSSLYVLGNASISQNLSVLGNSSVSGDSSVTGNLTVSGLTTLEALTVNGVTTSNGNVSIAQNLAVSGNASVAGNLTVAGLTTLQDLQVPGLTTLNGNVFLSGNTFISSLTLQGQSGFSGNINMNEFEILNVSVMEQDNVRVAMDGTAKTINLDTRADGSSPWTTQVTTSDTGFTVNNNVLLNGAIGTTVSIPSSNVSITGPEVVLGSVSSTTNLTLWGNLDIKGTTTNTRVESNVVQVGDLNLELGYLEVNTLSNLNGAGLTIGGEGGLIPLRPNLVYSSSDNAWQPNIDIITKGAEIARINTAGYFVSTLASNASLFTKVDSSTVNFSDKWRFKYDDEGDVVNLEHFESGLWVAKFVYSA